MEFVRTYHQYQVIAKTYLLEVYFAWYSNSKSCKDIASKQYTYHTHT